MFLGEEKPLLMDLPATSYEPADAIMDRISYDSYRIDIESNDPTKDLSMREVYGLDPAETR